VLELDLSPSRVYEKKEGVSSSKKGNNTRKDPKIQHIERVVNKFVHDLLKG
jgi:hypothetical protein